MQAAVYFYLEVCPVHLESAGPGGETHDLPWTIHTALEKVGGSEHLKYIADLIVWGNTAEEFFGKGEKIIKILLDTCFPIKRRKVKSPTQEIQFWGIKWQDKCCQNTIVTINKIMAMSPPTSKNEITGLPRC